MKYLVDMFQEYAYTAEIEASSPEEAEEIALKKYLDREIDPSSFTMCDSDTCETRCCGHIDEDGERVYD